MTNGLINNDISLKITILSYKEGSYLCFLLSFVKNVENMFQIVDAVFHERVCILQTISCCQKYLFPVELTFVDTIKGKKEDDYDYEASSNDNACA